MKKLLWFIVFAGSNLLAMEGGELPKLEVTEEGEITESSEEGTIGGLPLEYFKTLPLFILENEILPKLPPKERGRLFKALGHEYIGQLEEEKEKYLAEQQLMSILAGWNKAYEKATGLLENMKEVDEESGFQMLKKLIDGVHGMTIYGGERLTEPELEKLQEIVTLLINKGANVKQDGQDLLTSFIKVLAYYRNQPEEHKIAKNIVKQLIDAGIDVNTQAQGGFTALMIATGYRNADIVQMLLDAGADTTPINANKKTAADLAGISSLEIKQMILEKQKEQEAKETKAESKEEE